MSCPNLLFAGALCLGTAIPLSLFAADAVAETPATESPAADLAGAKLLEDAGRLGEAAAQVELALQQEPENGRLLAWVARLRVAESFGERDATRATGLRKRARECAERAEARGAGDVMTALILEQVQPDGQAAGTPAGGFSRQAAVEKLIRTGEEHFGRREFARAGECYRDAFALEPTNYLAALWAGDAQFAAREIEPACEWFRKAIAVNPDEETAHRYLGDALDRLGQHEAALAEHIAALLLQPYQRQTRQHFTAQLRERAEQRGRVVPRFPAMNSTLKDGKIQLAVDPADGSLLMAYNICAIGWRMKDFAAAYPAEKTARRSLPEELYAIDGLLEVVDASRGKPEDEKAMNLAKWQPVVDGLLALKKDGLLEAYVLLERPDAELAQDYPAYFAAHRDLLERYVRTYWCGFE